MTWIFEPNKDKTECKIYRPSKALDEPDRLIGRIYLENGKWHEDKANSANWLPVNQALAEMGLITREKANLADLGF